MFQKVKNNDQLANHVKNEGYAVFRGEENNVLGRYYDAALQFEASSIVRITGDCPLIDSEIVDNVITLYENEKVDLFGKQLAMHIAASNPLALSPDNIEKSIIDKEIELIEEELKTSGKSDEIIKKISIGKINKFKQDISLLTQDWVMEPKKKVQDIMNELNIQNLKIIDFCRYKIGE